MDNPFAALNNGPATIPQAVMGAYEHGRAARQQEEEQRRQMTARGAAGAILEGMAPTNALAGYAPNASPSQGNALLGPATRPQAPMAQPSSVADAWRTLAHTDPALFGQLRQLDNNQRKAAAEALKRNVEIGGRAMGAILEVPEDQRAAVYATQLKPWLESQGMENLPEQWDENFARAQLRLAATAAQALGHDVQREHLAWDIEDDKADNARADLNTQSLIDYREGQLANTRRGQDLADERGRRGQDVGSRDRRRGQDVTDRRARDLHGKKVRGKAVSPNEGIIQMPDGRKGVVRNGAWVDAATGKPL